MPSSVVRGRPRSRLGPAAVFGANLLPLFGVLWFGWDPATLVVIYALELLFTLPLAGVKALFAKRPPRADHDESGTLSVSHPVTDHRGSIDLVRWLPPVYPRNLPFAAAVINGSAWFLIVIGAVLAGIVSAGDALMRPEVFVSALALVIGQSVETWRDYLQKEYETSSPYAVIETPARQTFFLAFVLMATPGIEAFGVEGVLVVLVMVKLLIEWSAYRAASDGGGRLTGWLAGPESAADAREPIDIPEDPPEATIPTDRRAVYYTTLFDVVGRFAPFAVGPFIVLWFIMIAVLGGEGTTVAVAAVSVLVAAAFLLTLAMRVLMGVLQYGWLEYRRYGDRLVAYDTLVSEPQWATKRSVIRDVQVVPDRFADRLCDTRTVAVTTGWGDEERRRYLGPTAHGDDLIERFELPAVSTDLDPIDRRPIAVVIGSLAVFGVGTLLLVIGPWVTAGEVLFAGLVYGVFGIPFVGLLLRGVWVQAYPERTADPADR
ncbi:DUF6498-containing protein [Halorubrum vacuolatum]|uniref:Uncharacterized protein n=1 Tax=Halorubrum vacuolatum TaxID=63740 RepID=A0A238UQA2_HALVU|nr:DUF6498-containing protein [Halorubrum vacuolatum]SNR23479.1 hypothetical protein SAMN06264855_101125 [Halorubrum vacuolatum]